MEAGVEGTVRLRLYINEDGKVEETLIEQGIPKTGLNEAAIEAVTKTKWKPAMQRDKPVGVWYSVSIIFRLSEK